MTKLCRKYMSEVKCFFAVKGRKERKYLKDLAKTVEDFCVEENVTTIEELHSGFADPNEVFHTYCETLDADDYIKRIRISRWVKAGIIALILASLLVSVSYSVYRYNVFKVFEDESVYNTEELID